MAVGYTTDELIAVAVSTHLRDEEVCFIGIGTGGRAFILAVGIPLVACRLAQLSHAPNLVPMLGPLRLDYGFPITHPDYAKGGGQFNFGVGFTRDF